MKAAYLEQNGGPEVFKYGDLPEPKAGPGDVLVDIVAASVNGADWKVRRGEYSALKFPYVLGRDFSGTVAALGEGVTDFKVGDVVFGVQGHAHPEPVLIAARGWPRAGLRHPLLSFPCWIAEPPRARRRRRGLSASQHGNDAHNGANRGASRVPGFRSRIRPWRSR